MQRIHFHNPSIVICEWFPMGRSNMISFNKLTNAHKSFIEPTVYGLGILEDKDLNKGCYRTNRSGFFIKPVDYSSSEFFKAEFLSNSDEGQGKGVEIDKDGACYIGVNFKNDVPIDKTKEITDKTEIEFNHQLISLLADNQVDLLECAYGVKDIVASPFALSSYSMVVTDALIDQEHKEVTINNTIELLQSYKFSNVLMPFTDWIMSHFSIDNCHIFIGMKAMVCIGVPSNSTRKLLKEILFQRTIMDISLKMFSNLWITSKSIGDMSSSMLSANYKELKKLNEDLGKINIDLSRHNIFSEMMTNAVKSKMSNSESYIIHNPKFKDIDYGEGLKVELEKAEDRNLIIKQIFIDVSGLRGQLQQQMNLIMTKNGERLNLIIFILTIFSVIGISDILGFTTGEIILTTGVAAPFILYLIYWWTRFNRNYK